MRTTGKLALAMVAIIAIGGCTAEQIAEWERMQRGGAQSPGDKLAEGPARAAEAQTLVPPGEGEAVVAAQESQDAALNDANKQVLDYVAQLEGVGEGIDISSGGDTGESKPSSVDNGDAQGGSDESNGLTVDVDELNKLSFDGGGDDRPGLRTPSSSDEAMEIVPLGPAAPRVLSVSLPVEDQRVVATNELRTIGANEGLDTEIPEHRETLTRVIEELERELAADPANPGKQWRLSLLRLAAGRPAEATDLSEEMTLEQRSLISAAVSSIDACGRLLTSRTADPGEALQTVNSLQGILRSEAELTIPVVALCTKVKTFGVYDEMPEGALMPYSANRVIVYYEVENFKSDKEGPGRYRTSLSSRLELFNTDGQSLWVQEESGIEDMSKQYREDFFLAQLVTLPSNMGKGEYVLKVTVTDQLASNTNEALLRFRVGMN